jgi:hypothetical protein
MNDRAEQLIALLLNKEARLDERDDAAMDLAGFDDAKVIAALAVVGSDEAEDDLLLASCGTSLAEIWARRGNVDENVLQHLTPAARRETSGTLVKAPMSNALADYRLLLEQFLMGAMPVEDFQTTYLDRFKNEGPLDASLFELLDELFGDVDSFTTDSQLLAESPGFYLDEAGLREKVSRAMSHLSAMAATSSPSLRR